MQIRKYIHSKQQKHCKAIKWEKTNSTHGKCHPKTKFSPSSQRNSKKIAIFANKS